MVRRKYWIRFGIVFSQELRHDSCGGHGTFFVRTVRKLRILLNLGEGNNPVITFAVTELCT